MFRKDGVWHVTIKGVECIYAKFEDALFDYWANSQ